MVFNVTHYLELHHAITFHYNFHVFPTKKIKVVWTIYNTPYMHGQFGTQVPNNYFNYCKVIMQLQ